MLDLGLDIKVVKLLEDTKDNVKNTPLRLIITLKNWTNAIYLDIFRVVIKSITYSKKSLQLV
jgi:hypothetical protein